MQDIPNFAPRGHGLFIPKTELTLYENPNPPPTSLNDAIEKTMSAINCPPFQRRLEQYLKESEENPMNYRNEKHRIAFIEAIEKLNRKDYALMSAVYLLTAEHALWMIAKHSVGQNEICFDAIKLQNSTENAYTLFCCIVDELAADERISALYDLWYEQREEVLKIYTQELPERVPIVDNKEFKSIKNAVIQEAMNILADRTIVEDEVEESTPDADDPVMC